MDLLSNYSAASHTFLGRLILDGKPIPWLVPLPPPEVFLAGLSAATTPYDSVIASLAARGHSRALHKQAVQAVWIRAGKSEISETLECSVYGDFVSNFIISHKKIS